MDQYTYNAFLLFCSQLQSNIFESSAAELAKYPMMGTHQCVPANFSPLWVMLVQDSDMPLPFLATPRHSHMLYDLQVQKIVEKENKKHFQKI